MNSTDASARLPFRLASAGLAAGAAAHVLAFAVGPAWMVWLGAPPSIVASRAAGSWPAPVGTLGITVVLLALAIACWMPARTIVHRLGLALLALLFVLRGLLVLPYWAGLRDWRTPIGHFVVRGESFAAGSLVVLAIGLLVAGGLLCARPHRFISSRANP
ncbi:hypothetical protein SAMN03159338_2314 [Sphingomonas sp. NFR04]|uniref:hypothetical protein n=1 Tax=Sphingomonas sp. NFR04 TaxID=1566283 RepID=UPI0008EE6FFB|nr:hypothetical protein [Sphingomonas sp. NFR04]SFJ78446.1 hypothetical protein SAMN03159338_2314 [Sphingomonas sp. NFR04]